MWAGFDFQKKKKCYHQKNDALTPYNIFFFLSNGALLLRIKTSKTAKNEFQKILNILSCDIWKFVLDIVGYFQKILGIIWICQKVDQKLSEKGKNEYFVLSFLIFPPRFFCKQWYTIVFLI